MSRTAGNLGRIAVLATVTSAMALAGAGNAAADEWPQPGGAFSVYETKNFATPSDVDFWNPLSDRNRLSSPFGISTRIVCTAFHGVQTGCWQADREGNPHKLNTAPLPVPWAGSSQTGRPGPTHYVYPS